MKKFLVSITTAATLAINSYAGGGGFAGATEVTQILNNAQLMSIYGEEVQQYQTMMNQLTTQMNQLQQDIMSVQMMTQNLQNLSNFNWQDFAMSVSGLQNVMNSANGISYAMSNYDNMFNNQFKGYNNWYSIANNNSLTPGQKANSFSQQYQTINQTTRDTVKGTLDSLNLQMNDFQNEAATINTLKNNSAGAAGNKAVIQAANDIALFQVDQLRKMRLTMMNQINMTSQFMAAENERREIEAARGVQKSTQGSTPVIGDETQVGSW